MRYRVVVYFSSGRVPLKLLLRLAPRRPRLAWRGFWSRLVMLGTWSSLNHCAAGSGAWVVNVDGDGCRLWGLADYLTKYHILTHAYIVPTPLSPDHHIIHKGKPARALPIFIKWLTGGRWATGDCVCTTRKLLRHSGVNTPRWACSPKLLDRWLSRQGYEKVPL